MVANHDSLQGIGDHDASLLGGSTDLSLASKAGALMDDLLHIGDRRAYTRPTNQDRSIPWVRASAGESSGKRAPGQVNGKDAS